MATPFLRTKQRRFSWLRRVPRPVEAQPKLPESSTQSRENFVTSLAAALHASGMPAHKVEEFAENTAQELGTQAIVFSTPTMLIIGYGPKESQRTVITRVRPVDVHLARLDRLNAVAQNVLSGQLTVNEGQKALESIDEDTKRLHPLSIIFTSLFLSAVFASLLGGGLYEALIGSLIGAMTGALSLIWPQLTKGAPILTAIGATVATFLADSLSLWMSSHGIQVSNYIAMLAGVISLVPGFTLTLAITELATGHLASGTARATAALASLLQLAVGIALGGHLSQIIFGDTPIFNPPPVNDWINFSLLIPTAIAIGFFSNAPKSRLLPIIAVTIIGYLGARLGAIWLSPELGGAIGAFLAALASRFHGSHASCPQLLTLSPAIFLLVPGSFGLKSVSLFLGSNIESGLDAAFRMVLIAMAIAAGLLTAQSLGRPKPSL